MNLHHLVRGAISTIHPDERIIWYRSLGQENSKGKITPIYAPGIEITAQVQSANDEKLAHSNGTGDSESIRRFYLYGNKGIYPAPQIRPLARSGDIFKREDGTYWQATGRAEDFNASGWSSIMATLQVKAPDLADSSETEQ